MSEQYIYIYIYIYILPKYTTNSFENFVLNSQVKYI